MNRRLFFVPILLLIAERMATDAFGIELSYWRHMQAQIALMVVLFAALLIQGVKTK